MPLQRRGFDGPAGLRAFDAALRRTLVRQTVTLRDPQQFRARVAEVELAQLRLISATVGALAAHRRPGDAAGQEDARVFLLLGLRATGTIGHRRGSEPIGPDRLVIVPGTEPFDVEYPAPAHLLFVALPHRLVTDRYPGLDGPIRSAALDPVARALCRQLPHLMAAAAAATAAQRPAVAGIVDTVLDTALRTAGVETEVDPLVALRTAAERLIEQRLDDPELGVPWLARQLVVSPRQLHRAFATGATTPHAWIRQRRLQACADALTWSDAPVAQLAHRYGFASASHLGTQFRARFGTPPGRWRAERRDRPVAGGPAA
jgi:AraC-like DNA-binding protein